MFKRQRFAVVAVALALLTSAPAYANTITYVAAMSGASENPPNASPATGFATITYDDVIHSLLVDEAWSGLTGGNPAAAHIHCCVAAPNNVGVAVGFPSFPATTSGSYLHVFDLTDPTVYTAAFFINFGGGTAAGAEAALIAGLGSGQAYVNIHNATFPGGEIRGQIEAVPEPATLTLFALGAAGAAIRRRRASRAR